MEDRRGRPIRSPRQSRAERQEQARHEESLRETRKQTDLSERSLRVSRRSYVLTAVGAIIAVVAILVPLLLPSQPTTQGAATVGTAAAPPTAQFGLSALTVGDPRDIDAEAHDASGEGPSTRSATKATVVDVTLKNTGTAPGVVVRADFVLDQQAMLSDCFESGGEARVSAEYTFKIPGTPGISEPVALPYTVSKDIRFVVAPQSVDRLTFSFGPEEFTASSYIAAMYAGHIVLTTDTGDRIDLSEVGVVAPAGKGSESLDTFEQYGGANPACLSANAKKLTDFLSTQFTRAPELEQLADRYSRYAG